MPSGCERVWTLRTSDGKLDAADAARLAALADRLKTGPKTVLIHVHGGLVTQKDGEAVAHALSGSGPLSYNAGADVEQIYPIWRSGAFETLATNWRDLFDNDRLYRALFKKLIGYVSSKVLSSETTGRSVGTATGLSPAEISRRMRSVGDAPFADLDERAKTGANGRAVELTPETEKQVETEFGMILAQSQDFTAAADDIAAALSWSVAGRAAVTPHGDSVAGRQSLGRLRASVQDELKALPAQSGRGLIGSAAVLKALVKHSVAIAWRVIKRLRSGRGHGVHATIVEEMLRELYGDIIGAAIWGMMKQDAHQHFDAGGLGLDLISALTSHQHKIVLVVHSAGSVWAAQLLKTVGGNAHFPKMTLLLLAPAVTASEFADAIKVGASKIGAFRLYAMGDKLERADALLGPGTGVIYPSSLLYLVSGLFEERDSEAWPDAPILGMERFIGQAPNWIADPADKKAVTDARAFLGSIASSAIFSKVAGGPGLSSDSTTHGDFDNDPATLQSVGSFL